MSAVAERQPARLTIADRLVVALPLASIYVWLCIVYCVEAWKRLTPWLFTDELEYTQLSRAIAATGHAARRGEPHSFRSLYTVVTAPFWLIDDVGAAFAAIKYFDVFVMTSVLFPTYFLARLLVGRGPALFAAAGAAMIPSLAYSSWIAEETLAYPYSALCFFLIAKALLTRSRGWIVGAVAASALAPVVRGELVVVPIAFAFALFFMWWTTERTRKRRAAWSLLDWLGVVTLGFGAVYLLSGALSHHSQEWYSVTTYWKHRIFVYGDWASGALCVGLGAIPLVLGLAALAPLRGEERSRELRVFRSVALAGIGMFWFYTAMKAAYLSTVFASRVEERNLIYVAPLLFVGTALVLQRRRVNLWALAAAAAYGAYVIVGTPLYVGGGLYSDALGLAIFQQANRYFLLSDGTAQWILLGVLAAGVGVAVLLGRARWRAGVGLAGLLATAVLAWNVTGEVAAAAGSVTVARDMAPALGHPFTWVDDNTHLKPTLYLAQGVADQNPEWMLEFWNRSITTVSSVDGTLGGPGPAGSPNITATGQLYWTLTLSTPGNKVFDYAVEDWPCIDFAGTLVTTHRYRGGSAEPRQWRLIQLTKPNRLRALCSGIYSDGWSGPNDSTYFRFVGKQRGWLRIQLSRQGYPGSPVDVQLGTIGEAHKEPVLGRVLEHHRVRLKTNEPLTIWLPTPAGSFAARTVIEKKFSPGNGDVRTLGALVTYHWYAKKPKG
ncbi:MAG TPA: hypothetical protein VFL60_04575 [Gaiellaceae bacterium]|nr:hypothetical protein [Gaiellaceae bacterium]